MPGRRYRSARWPCWLPRGQQMKHQRCVMCVTCMPVPSSNKAAHSDFESQGRHHQTKKNKQIRFNILESTNMTLVLIIILYIVKNFKILFLTLCSEIKYGRNTSLQMLYETFMVDFLLVYTFCIPTWCLLFSYIVPFKSHVIYCARDTACTY